MANKQASPGSARMPGPSYRELITRDNTPPPGALLTEQYTFAGDNDIAFANYTSQDYAELEFARMWPKVWQWACHETHLPETGDYCVYDIGNASVLLVRNSAGAVNAFVNACMHRATQLKASGSCGFVNAITCPFHGWTYDLDGNLAELPHDWDFPHVDQAGSGLRRIRCEIWNGFVFVNFDPQAVPLEDYLEVLPDHFEQLPQHPREITLHIEKHLPANWKASQEAFLELYHVRETHAGGHPETDLAAQYDVFGKHVSRFMHTIGAPCPMANPVPSEQVLMKRLWREEKNWIPGAEEDDVPTVPENETARDVYSALLKRRFSETYGHDFSNVSTAAAIDSIQYFVFPNFFLFPGLSLNIAYRFRPKLNNPDQCLFDLFYFQPTPAGRSPNQAPEPIRLGLDDSFTQVPEVGHMARIFDEDTGNLRAQTNGFKISAKTGATLGNYQEIRIRHLHQTNTRYLSNE